MGSSFFAYQLQNEYEKDRFSSWMVEFRCGRFYVDPFWSKSAERHGLTSLLPDNELLAICASTPYH